MDLGIGGKGTVIAGMGVAKVGSEQTGVTETGGGVLFVGRK